MAQLTQISPIVPVTNMARSTQFFTEVLGFKAIIESDHYVYLARDKVAVRLVPAGANKDMTHPNAQMHCYIDVTGIDELYASMQPQIDALPKGRLRAPFDTEYGQREFHVIDPDALLLSFGEAIKPG